MRKQGREEKQGVRGGKGERGPPIKQTSYSLTHQSIIFQINLNELFIYAMKLPSIIVQVPAH